MAWVGDNNDTARVMVDLWVGDSSNTARHAVHAFVGGASNTAHQLDAPYNLTVSDDSECIVGSPNFVQNWSWNSFHFGNVTNAELWVDGSFHDTAAPGESGGSSTAVTSLPEGTYDLEVRYEFDDGTFSDFSNTFTLLVADPCP